MSPAEVYALISPSVAFIETTAATGSGILIRDGYVITNYHVVWPYESVRVVFPDGTELENVPVVGWDPMADLAVLGPVDVSAQPLMLIDGEGTALGSELLLLGYPAEVDLFPQPTITRGILSGFREWERLGITYSQTDAAIAGGQSGGALVNSRGEVVGISTFSFSEAGFGLAASSADIMPIAEKLIQGEFTSGLGDRRLPVGRGSFEVDLDLRNYWDTSAFVLDATAGTILEVGIEGSGDGWFHVSDPFGLILEVNDGYTGVEHGAVELLTGGVHFLQVEMASGESSSFDVSSSVRLIPLNDPDDGQAVAVGETVAGSLDHFLDWDWYSVRLNEGQTVRIATDSINVDTVLYVDFPKSRNNQVVSDDDSGGGLGGNSELVYRAPHTGEYFIAVTEAEGNSSGGYYLSVEAAREGTETVSVPPSPQTVDSRFGTMVVFEDPLGYFSIQAPEAWLEAELDESQGETFYAFDPETNSDIVIVAEDVLALGAGELSLTKYADLIESSVLIPAGAEDITRETVRTSQGSPAIIFQMSLLTHRVIRFIYLFDNNIAVSVAYSFTADRFDMGKQLSDYSFDSFRVPSATSTPTLTNNTPTPIPSATPTVTSFYLRDFVNGSWLEQQDPQLATSIRELGWIQDGINATESEAIQDLLYIAVTSRSVAASIVSLSWVQDGVHDVEAGAFRWMNNIGSARVASSVVSLGWVEDGIDEIEVKAIEEISYIDYGDAEIASSVVSLGWVEDGIENTEVDLIEALALIADKNAEEALRIVGMPFLETIEPPDISAMESLRQLVAFKPSAFLSVMSHAALRDGISDDVTPIVATLDGVAGTNPDLIDVLLETTRVLLERRIITLPLTGEVVLDIIRTAPGAARSMDLLEHSVRGIEEYMDSPLPTKYVGLLYENAVSSSTAGTNFGTHIAILPEYDIDDDSQEAESSGSTIAHEVAHYYWSGNEDWVDEGAADFMASIVEGARTGQPIGVTGPPCGYAGSIAEMESLGISRGDIEFRCNYSLGERLFVDLHLTLGDERFRQGFRALYLASEIEDDADDRRGTSVGIEQIREAFRSDDGAESTVIARWYNGTEPYDLSRLDPHTVDPGLPGINGRIDEAYIATSTDGPAVSVFSAQDVTDWVYLTLKYSYNVSGGPHEVPLEIVEYYEDGFEFRRRSDKLTAEDRYIGGTSWWSVDLPPSRKWYPGRYWVYVYAGERKVAEVQYEVTS